MRINYLSEMILIDVTNVVKGVERAFLILKYVVFSIFIIITIIIEIMRFLGSEKLMLI